MSNLKQAMGTSPMEMKQSGINRPKLFITLLTLVIFIIASSFKSQEPKPKIVGEFIDDLASRIGKKGGCGNSKKGLILMEAYQIIYQEYGGITDKRKKANGIRSLVDKCTTSQGNCIIFKSCSRGNAVVTTINGGISTKRDVPPYMLALEMMTPKQQNEFLKALPNGLQKDYKEWSLENIEIKKEIDKSLKDKGIYPVDIDSNLSRLINSAIDETKTLQLKDYDIKTSELNKLLNNQQLLEQMQNKILEQKQ